MITIGGLFSGYGGLELGLEMTGGFKTVWHCEIEPYPSAILKERFQGVPNLGDITQVKWDEVKKVDLLCGGFPCQDISQAGKRKGIIKGETRSGLWGEFHKAIRILRPRYVVIENVSALSNLGLDIVLADLAQVGYDAEWIDLRASDFGAPHRRERLFIVAYPNNKRHESTNEEVCAGRNASYNGCSDVPHSSSERFQGQQQSEREEQIYSFKGKHGGWQTECGLDRVVDGPAFGLDESEHQELVELGFPRAANKIWKERIKALGNGVVPQVAQWVGERILETEKRVID